MLILLWILLFFIVCFILYLLFYRRKTKKIVDESENINVISQDRVDFIKNKYKSTEEIKKVKSATKDDVEAFYKSQMKDK